MWKKQNDGVPLDFDFDVGLTWWLLQLPDLPGVTLVAHGGDLDGYHSLIAIDPEHKVGIFIMVNGVDGFGSFTLSAVATQALRGMIEAKSAAQIPPARVKSPAAPLPEEASRPFPGFYATPNGLVRLKVENGKLKVNAFGNWLDGVYHQDGTITLEARFLLFRIHVPALEEIGFIVESLQGVDYLCERLHGTLLAPAEKVKPVAVTDSWLRRSGKYHVENPDPRQWLSDVSLGMDSSSGLFVIEAKVAGSRAKRPLQPLSETEARLMGVGRNLGETLRIVPSSSGEKLVFQGYMLSKD